MNKAPTNEEMMATMPEGWRFISLIEVTQEGIATIERDPQPPAFRAFEVFMEVPFGDQSLKGLIYMLDEHLGDDVKRKEALNHIKDVFEEAMKDRK